MLHVHRLFIATGKSGRCSLPLAVVINFQTFTQNRFLVQVYHDHETDSSKKCQSKHLTFHTASVAADFFHATPFFCPSFHWTHPNMQNNYTKNPTEGCGKNQSNCLSSVQPETLWVYTTAPYVCCPNLPRLLLKASLRRPCDALLTKLPSVQRCVKLGLLAEDSVAVRARRRKGVVRSGSLAGGWRGRALSGLSKQRFSGGHMI